MNISLKRKLEVNLKETISKIVLFFLYRGINIVKKVDEEVLKEIASWNENIIIKIATYEDGPSIIIKKQQDKIIRIKEANKCDIEIVFKSLDAAFLVLTAREGISKAYAEHRFILKGDITKAMSLVRCIDIVETYLFPKVIAKNLVKTIKKIKIPKLVTYLRVIVNY